MVKEQKIICLNCGAMVSGQYCRHCGQRTDTQRFTLSSFFKHTLQSLTRLSGNFFKTMWMLLCRPWTVIRNYVYGKRVSLLSPITMLILLAMYWGLMIFLFPSNSHHAVEEQLSLLKFGDILKWLYGSLTFQYIFLTIPIAISTWLVYRPDLKGRFNFAEVFIASLYLACTYLLLCFLFYPLELQHEVLANIILVAIISLYGIISLLKAFPQRNAIKTIAKLLLWGLVSGCLLFVFLICFAIPMFIGSGNFRQS